jgi:hypothetical protein
VHDVAAVADTYLPAAQSVHSEAADELALSCPYLPAAHKEPAQEDAPEVNERAWTSMLSGEKNHGYFCKNSDGTRCFIHGISVAQK